MTEQQWEALYDSLQDEDWDDAAKLVEAHLKRVIVEDDQKTLARLRYAYLFVSAGRVAAGKMTFDDLAKRVGDFVGKEVRPPALVVVKDCSARPRFNMICPGDSPTRLFITSVNRAETTILMFEYVTLNEGFDIAKHDGKAAQITGTIEAIVPNPNKSPFLVMRIYVVDASILVAEGPLKLRRGR